MTRARPFARLKVTARFDRKFSRLTEQSKAECVQALEHLVEKPLRPGLHLKPIQPGKTFWEARINRAERLILLPEGDTAYVVDVVSHDDIKRWSK